MSYSHYLVLDLEATCCDAGTIPRVETEIIEVGAVMVQAGSWIVVSEFAEFVRPVRHATLTAFCTELTSITQSQVDQGRRLSSVFEQLNTWWRQFGECLFCSWGDYDRKQIERECSRNELPYPLPSDHLNLKKEFSQRQQFPRRLGMAGAMRAAGLPLLGTHHRGIDDARNIAKLLQYVVGDQKLNRSRDGEADRGQS